MAEQLSPDGPDTVEIQREPDDRDRARRAWLGVLLPLMMIDLFVVASVLAIVHRGASNTPVILWVFLAGSIAMAVLYCVAVIPKKARRIRAAQEGRVGSWRLRLPRGDWVWSVSGFGAHGVESILVRTADASGQIEPEVSGPDAAAWCLDASSGGPIAPVGSVRGREEDQSGWRFEPGPHADAQLFLTIDRAHGAHPGWWSVRIDATYTGSKPPPSLVVQRLSSGEARGLRPDGV